MAVLVNYKICDNAAECGGIAVCPTGAMYWDDVNGAIRIDNNLCISCKNCVRECPVGAIQVAITEEEYESIKTNIECDHRTIEELFVERYGAMPIDENLVMDENQINTVINTEFVVFVEQFQDNSIQCLLNSIPMSVILERYGGKYVKQQIDDNIEGQYPCLIIYQEGKMIGCVNGHYEEKDVDEFFKLIDKIMKQ